MKSSGSRFRLSSDIGTIDVCTPGLNPTDQEKIRLFTHFEPILRKGMVACEDCGGRNLQVRGSAVFEDWNTLLDVHFICTDCGKKMHYVMAGNPREDLDDDD